MFLKSVLCLRDGFSCSYGIDSIKKFFHEILSFERVFLLLEMLCKYLRETKKIVAWFLLVGSQ